MCVKAWRFGSPIPVGGFGTVDQLVDAYQQATAAAVDPAALHWWEVLGTLRWGVICIVQTFTHLSGTVRSVELAAIGRRVCEVEWDLLELLGLTRGPTDDPAGVASDGTAPAVHDVPSAAELLDAVSDFLVSDVIAGTEGRLRFHARVAANVVAMVGRQITLGPPRTSITPNGSTASVWEPMPIWPTPSGPTLDDQIDEVHAVVVASVAAKLAVAHPGYGGPATAG